MTAERGRGTGLGASHVVIDSKNPQILYVSSTFYGVYKSTDGGITWALKNKGVGAPDFYTIAMHPTDTRRLYVGAAGGGIYRTDDGGETWTEANNGLTDTSVYDIVFDPNAPSVMYAITLREIFKSVDGGQIWAPVFRENPQIMDPSYHRRLILSPSKNVVFLVGTGEKGYRRGMNDQRWVPLGEDLKDVRVTSFAYHSGSKTLYAGAVFSPGLYKSTDGGRTWTLISNQLKQVWVNRIEVDPLHPQHIYLATKNRGMLKSADGGVNWKPINNGLTEIEIKALGIHPSNPDHLVIATYGRGIFTSSNGGAHWVHRPVPLYPTWDELNAALTRKVQAKLPQPPPPPAEFSKCQTCHAWTDPILNGPANQTFWRTFPSRRDWTETIHRMRIPAQLTPDEESKILKYLNTYYGPG